MKQFKMRVKKGQTAEAIQNYMFACGVKWCGQYTDHMYLDAEFFFAEGDWLTYVMSDEQYFEEHEAEEFFFATPVQELQEIQQPIKSDGGSSDYYKLTITNKAGESIQCETGDVLRVMVGNDYDLSNVIKAARRMYEASQGRGKEGATIEYDANKIIYFATEFAHWHKEC